MDDIFKKFAQFTGGEKVVSPLQDELKFPKKVGPFGELAMKAKYHLKEIIDPTPVNYSSGIKMPSPTNAPNPTPSPGMKFSSGEPAVLGQGTAGVDPKVQNFLEKKVFPVVEKYGIPKAVAAGMFGAEGRLEGLGAERNNYYNIAAYDGNEDSAFRYKKPEDGVKAWAELITSDPRYKKAYELRHDPDAMLREIQNAGYAGDPKTYQKRAKNGYPSYESFTKDTPEYKYYRSKQ